METIKQKEHFDVSVGLSSERDELYLTDEWDFNAGEAVQRVQIKASGYQKINSKAGLMILTPRTTVVDGKNQPNPFIIRDKDHKMVEVIARKIAFGFAPNGQLSAIDQTVSLNPKRMLANNLLPLIERYPALGRYTVLSDVKAAEKKAGLFLPIIETGFSTLGVFLPDVTKPELQKFWREYTTGVAFADRTVQTMCERNAIRKHPSVSIKTLPVQRDSGGNLVASILLRAWKLSDELMIDMREMASQIEAGHISDEVEIITSESDGIQEDIIDD